MARASFDAALACVLRHEGGYSDHPDDPGGATMMGITRATLSRWRGQAVSKDEVLTLTRAEAAEIYRARYWHAVGGDLLPRGLDLAVFDFAVNSGPSRAIRALQQVLGVTIDGRIGRETLGAVQTGDAPVLIAALCANRIAFLKRLSTFATFGRGWMRRVHEVEQASLRLAAAEGEAVPRPDFPQAKQEMTMEITKTIFLSRTVWANAIGFGALALSWFGFDTSSVDKAALTDSLLQVVAGLSFVVSTLFRVIATRRLI